MEYDSPIIYGLEFQARSLSCYAAETDLVQFFVGTQSLRYANQIHLVTFDDEQNSLSKQLFKHPSGEVWSISSPPSHKNVLATVFNHVSGGKTEMEAKIWSFNTDEGSLDESISVASDLREMSAVEAHGDVKSIIWYPSTEKMDFVALVEGQVMLYEMREDCAQARLSGTGNTEGKNSSKHLTCGAWDPHHNCASVAAALDNNIKAWDVRTMNTAYTIDNAHNNTIRSLSFNPNKQYYLASCGDDCKTKFWDVRKGNAPLKTLQDHSHWVWSVSHNHFHDQLLLTSSSDNTVILYNLPSVSSEPFGNLIRDDDEEDEDGGGDDDCLEGGDGGKKRKDSTPTPSTDSVVMRYEDHEESAYCCEWSSADPWVFASLSYDGRLVINRVPRQVKYQILL